MIAKRIPRRAATSSAARLVRYMVAAEGGIEPQSWARTADYILVTRDATTQGEKVGGFRVTNCHTDDPGDATTLIQATQAKNTRSKADKTYHLVFAFPPGEHPPLEVLHQIEDEFCEVLGYADHQRISAVHIDTEHLHVHIAINKVHPTGLQNIEPFYDKQRLMEACARLEIKHDLTRINHGLEDERSYDRANRIHLGPERQHDSRFRVCLRKSYARALTERPEATAYNDLRKLPWSSLAHGPERYSMLLPGHARDRMDQGRTEHLNGVRRAGNGVDRDGVAIGSSAADMEAQAGIESLTGYVTRDVAPTMRKATTWQELHAVLAEHGLQIKARGAGLVIGDPDLRLWCKASECGRDLSMKALTDRLGPFERDQTKREPGSRGYAPRPRQDHPSSAALFTDYQRERQAAITGRKTGLAAIRAERAAETERIRRWAAAQRMIQKVGPKGPSRGAFAATTRTQVATAREAAKARAEAATAQLQKATNLPTWNQWLMHRAERGDTDALAVLRAREEREERIRGDLLTAEKAEWAKTWIMDSLKPQARHDGTMAYRTADGGLVLDRKTHVKAEKATAGAALVALTLAAQRFDGQPLDVQGSDQFRQDVARLAGMHRVRVTFSDPALEIARLAVVREKEQVAVRLKPETGDLSRLVDQGSDRDEQQRKERKRMPRGQGRDSEI